MRSLGLSAIVLLLGGIPSVADWPCPVYWECDNATVSWLDVQLPSDGTIVPGSAYAFSWVTTGTIWTIADHCSAASGGGFDFDSAQNCDYATAGTAMDWWSPPEANPPPGYIWVCGQAQACTPDASPELYTYRCWGADAHACLLEPPATTWPVGIVWGVSIGKIRFEYVPGPTGLLPSLSVSATATTTWANGDVWFGKLTRRALLVRHAQDASLVGATLEAGPRTAYVGFEDLGGGTFSRALSVQGVSGLNSIYMIELQFDDERFDVDGSGRFNDADVSALALIGEPTPSQLERWDLNANSVLDAEDASILQAILDVGLGSGLLGDRDASGSLTCTDLTGLDSLFGYELGQEGYRIELDFDLDGITDENDRHRCYHSVLPGDVTADRSVNLTDLSMLLMSYGLCDGQQGFNRNADVNADGCVNLVDQAMLLAHFGTTCQ